MVWTYTAWLNTITERESFNGYSQKVNPPIKEIHHRIMDGKREVAHAVAFAESKHNDQIAKDFQLIVNAVNASKEGK